MLNAFWWGLLATSSLIIGGIIATRFSLKEKTIGLIMAFAGGTTLIVLANSMMSESFELGKKLAGLLQYLDSLYL